MMCLMIFDHLNDIIFTKNDEKFNEHIRKFAVLQGLLHEDSTTSDLDTNIILQIFSPLVTSQRIMSCQFGNSYTSLKCEDVNLCFDDYMGYLFVCMGSESISEIKHFLRICITITTYLCGPDVSQIKDDEICKTVTNLIDSWNHLQENDQAIFVEAIEQLVVNSDLVSVAVQALSKSVEQLSNSIECSKIHALLLVKNKLLSLYSSNNAKELCQSDIFFSKILSHSVAFTKEDLDDASTKTASNKIQSLEILLASSDGNPICLPHVAHIIRINEGICLIYLIEVGNAAVSSSLYETFLHLHTMQIIQIQRDVQILRPAFENLDSSVKKLNDALKKNKNTLIETSVKQLVKKWDTIRKKYQDFIKTNSDEALLRAETLVLGFFENLKQLFHLTNSSRTNISQSTQQQAMEVAQLVSEKLEDYSDFLQVKAIRNFMFGSSSLTITKYLEEFPGLVHFLYVDRTNHRITTPTLDSEADESAKITKKKIWTMIKFARNHLQEGDLSIIWKDTIFSYAYFLWFEDLNGTMLKPTVFPSNSNKTLPLPGLLGTDFYPKLKEICFPKMAPRKIKCFELFCVHLGLVTPTCVLEHIRRLAATVWELRGDSNQSIDLL